ncbi:hypothetical protein EIP86_002985 [Pleurotus ostreatoroseus]|nr:hypothetical protein EIP86_002985 [Pleurotus ostreatoroseus]
MPPKRKPSALDTTAGGSGSSEESKTKTTAAATRKARVSRATTASKAAAEAEDASGSASGEKSSEQAEASAPKSWSDVVLEGEGEGEGEDIRLLQKEPSFKASGNCVSRFDQFSQLLDATDNTLAQRHRYVFFEKKRIFEGKKKTATRVRNESSHPAGFELHEHRYVWVPA